MTIKEKRERRRQRSYEYRTKTGRYAHLAPQHPERTARYQSAVYARTVWDLHNSLPLYPVMRTQS